MITSDLFLKVPRCKFSFGCREASKGDWPVH